MGLKDVLLHPCIPDPLISLLFVREKKFHDLIIFGAVIGFIGGTLFLIYEIVIRIVAAPDPSVDGSP